MTTLAVRDEVLPLSAAFSTAEFVAGTGPTLPGRSLVAGPDESNRFRVPLDLEFSTEMPGGYGPGHVVLERPPDWDVLDATYLLGDCRFFDQAGDTVYQARVVSMPKSGANEITVECEGYSKSLEDRQDLRQIFVDADQGAWGDMSTSWREQIIPVGQTPETGSWAPNQSSGNPELWQQPNASTYMPYIVNQYYAPEGVDVRSLYYAWRRLTLSSTSLDNSWSARIHQSDDYSSPFVTSGELRAAGPSSGTLSASTGYRNAEVMFTRNNTTAAFSNHALIWTQLAVYGTTLTKRGSSGATSHQGLYASDMVEWIVDNYCPLVYADISFGNIEVSSFSIPHAVFRENTTPRAAIESLALLGGSAAYPLDWFVYESNASDDSRPHFHLRTPGTYGTDWRVRQDGGAEPDFAGYNAQERPNGVLVRYNDGIKDKTTGPVGSNTTTETTLLQVSDPNHPANLRGIDVWHSIDVGLNSLAGAQIVGQVYLAEKNRHEWMGSITQTGPLKEDRGGRRPPYKVHAGDRVIDETDTDTRSRYISATTYSDSSRAVSMQIAPRAQRFDLLLARLQLAMMPLGVGGTSHPEGGGPRAPSLVDPYGKPILDYAGQPVKIPTSWPGDPRVG